MQLHRHSLPSALPLALVAVAVLGACSSAPEAAGPTPTSTPTASPPAQINVTPAATANPTAQPTQTAPAAATPSPESQTAEPGGGGGESGSVAGSWVGTITEDGDSQGIRFELSEIVGVISGGAILESGDVQQLRGTLDGNSLTLEYQGGVHVVYEGMIAGDIYSGTFTRDLNGQAVGNGTFETTLQP